MTMADVPFNKCKKLVKALMTSKDDELLFMPYYTNGGFFQNSKEYHFSHIFYEDRNFHSAKLSKNVVLKGIFADHYVDNKLKREDAMEHLLPDIEIRTHGHSKLYSKAMSLEKVKNTTDTYHVDKIYKKFFKTKAVSLIKSVMISLPPKGFICPMRTWMGFSSISG